MAGINGLAHIGLFITDIEKSKKFYTEVLEFETIYECALDEPDGTSTKIAFMKNGDLTIELVQVANPSKRADGWIDHIALRVENIEAVRETLLSRGVKFETDDITFAPGVFPNGSKWILFRGPDNEHLEITEVMKY